MALHAPERREISPAELPFRSHDEREKCGGGGDGLIPPPFLAVRSFVLSRRNHSVSTPKGRGLSLSPSLPRPDGHLRLREGVQGPSKENVPNCGADRSSSLPLVCFLILCSVLFSSAAGPTDGRTDADGRPLGGFGKFRRGGAHSSMSVCPSQRPSVCLSNGERGNREAGK